MFHKIKKWIISVVFLAIIAYAAWFTGNYVIVRTDEEFLTLPKEKFEFSTIYVDVREWGLLEYIDHPNILKGLVRRGYTDLQHYPDSSEFKNAFNEITDKLKEMGKELQKR
ncbi:MAG: hypothetical protein C4527_07995 [Candidatus Omnitrophota bacterium]|jgi:hypothetical protein|nr:MAG: hypothetical protein C4527_07995 [Candidatus Omnitrophota bacterium]